MDTFKTMTYPHLSMDLLKSIPQLLIVTTVGRLPYCIRVRG
jgi:hypothetical protein